MGFTRRLVRFAAMAIAAAALHPSASVAQPPPPVWSIDFNVSDGNVFDSFTAGNNQRTVAMNDSNRLYIAFFDNRTKTPQDNNFEIYFRDITPEGSPGITQVTSMANMSKFPSVATRAWGPGDAGTLADSGRVYIAWQDARLFSLPFAGEPKSYTVFFRTYQTRGGVGFGPEIQVSPYDSINAVSSVGVAVGDSSRVWIVWDKKPDEFTSSEIYFATYRASTRVMGPATQLTNEFNSSTSPSVTATREGVVHVAWVDNRSGRAQIWSKRFVPGTGWTADEQLVFSSGTATAPSIAADGQGHVHLVWVDNRDGNNEIYYKEYLPGTGWDPVDLRLTVNSASQIQPNVDADGLSNVFVVWTDARNGASNPDIFYGQRLGDVWATDIPCVDATSDPSNSVQRFPGITHDSLGQIYAAFSDERLPATGGKNKEVYYKFGTLPTAAPVPAPPAFSRLLRNYPNPFNPATTVEFALARDAMATLRAYDVHGRLVRTIFESYAAAGRRNVRWDGLDDHGRRLPSGAYFLRLEAGGAYQTRTVNLLK